MRNPDIPSPALSSVHSDSGLGLMALPRTPLAKASEELDTKGAEDVVDASALPPG